MCAKCNRLKAEGKPPIDHKRMSTEKLTQRIEERKEFRESHTVQIPARWASNDVRRARLRKIREILGLTMREFAAKVGMAFNFYMKVEQGKKNCAMVYIQMAEKHLKAHKNARYYEALKSRKQVADAKQQILGLGKVRAKAIAMHVGGIAPDAISSVLNIPVADVLRWTDGI